MKILIADDNEDFLMLIAELLRLHGHDPLLAHDGIEARNLLEYQPVDVIISDMCMPEFDGRCFNKYVREGLGKKDIPFVFVSGNVNPESHALLKKTSNDHFVNKVDVIDGVFKILNDIDKALLS